MEDNKSSTLESKKVEELEQLYLISKSSSRDGDIEPYMDNIDPNSVISTIDNLNESHYGKWDLQKKIYDNETNTLIGTMCEKTGFIKIEMSPKRRYAKFSQEIGRGSYKRIYKGYDYDEGKEVAWNVINTRDVQEDQLCHVYDEINLLKMIDHPYIIKYLNGWFNQENNEVVLISELFTGGSLIK